MSFLLTDNASPGSSDGMMPGFLMEEGIWKIGDRSDITYLARSANLPEGLYILPMFFLYFLLFFNGRLSSQRS